MKLVNFFLLALFLSSCGGKINNPESTQTEFFNVGFENALGNRKEYNLSEIAADIRYVPLETNDSCLLRRVVNYFFTDSLIFVRNYDHILKFSRDGKFLQRIGKSGKGPGEIDLIRIMSVLPEKNLIAVQLNWKRELYFFDFNGKLVKTFDFREPVSYVKVCPDGSYIYHERGAGGKEPYSFCLISESLDTLSFIRNNQFWENKSNMVITIGYNNFEEFYSAAGSVYVKSMYNDTVYTVRENKFHPSYFLDLGKFRLPPDLRPEKLGPDGIQQFRDNSNKYFWGTMFETPGKVFVAAHCYSGSIPSRYVLYDKSSNSGTFLADGNDAAKGFLNDMDGIIDFWPIGSINEREIFMPVNVMELKKRINEGGLRPVKDQKKQEEIKKKIMAMDDTDNPVLVVVTLKR